MTPPNCIPDDILSALLVGELAEEQAAAWEEHLLSCPLCVVRTHDLCSVDTLVAALGAGRSVDLSVHESSAVARLMSRLVDRSQFPALLPASHAVTSDTPTQHLQSDSVTDASTSQSGLAVSPSALPIGSILGPYHILQMLGEGGMGAVYKATHTKLDKVVAIKVLSPLVTQQPEAVVRFEREMRAVGKLTHPQIVQAFDAGEISGTHYLAMEFVEGCDLAQWVKTRGPLSIAQACDAIQQVAGALSAAHAAGLVHRDLKPSNLLLAKTGQIKLLDLGLALLADETDGPTEFTAAGKAFGTPDYMAPEQWEDAHVVDARTDLYALGCTLFFLLVGRPPYATDQYRTVVGKMKAHVTESIPDLQAFRADVPDDVAAIYRMLMAKVPSERYQSAVQLRDALAACLASNSAATLSAAALTSMPAAPQSDGQAPRSKRWLLAGLGSAVVLLLGVIVITITFNDGSKATVEVSGAKTTKIQIGLGNDKPIAATRDRSTWKGWPNDTPPPAIAPFDAAQAMAHQEAWAAHLGLPVEHTNSVGMKFHMIPPGEFLMGSTPEQIEAALQFVGPASPWQPFIRSEAPQHKVILTQPIYLGVHEVTQAVYEQVMGRNPSHFAATGAGKDDVIGMDTSRHPVEMVSWHEAIEFCATLSRREQLQPFTVRDGEGATPRDGTGYRIPSEAEWEFAARAGTTTKFWSGDNDEDLLQAGWFITNSGGVTHAVGEMQANPFGLDDIHGNICEWTQDGWNLNFYRRFQDQPAIDPCHPFSADNQRVIRGGRWEFPFRASNRNAGPSSLRNNLVGFRVVLSVDVVRQSINRIP